MHNIHNLRRVHKRDDTAQKIKLFKSRNIGIENVKVPIPIVPRKEIANTV